MVYKFRHIINEWKTFANNYKYNLVEKCLKLSQILAYQELDISTYIEKINNITKSVDIGICKTTNPLNHISILNKCIFYDYELKGNVTDYYNPKNNFLNCVIDKKMELQ